MNDLQCPECHGETIHPSTVAGLFACQYCGKVFPPPEDWAPPEIVPEPDADPVQVDLNQPIPDSVECVYGWRSWQFPTELRPGQTPLLRSVTHSEAYWTPRQPMVATCSRGRGRANGRKPGRGHEVPAEGCSCGLYSAKTYDHLMTMSYHTYDGERQGYYCAVGRVKCWGGYIEGDQGWKSEFGYPEKLWIPFEAHRLLRPLEEAYGVPVELRNNLRDSPDNALNERS